MSDQKKNLYTKRCLFHYISSTKQMQRSSVQLVRFSHFSFILVCLISSWSHTMKLVSFSLLVNLCGEYILWVLTLMHAYRSLLNYYYLFWWQKRESTTRHWLKSLCFCWECALSSSVIEYYFYLLFSYFFCFCEFSFMPSLFIGFFFKKFLKFIILFIYFWVFINSLLNYYY